MERDYDVKEMLFSYTGLKLVLTLIPSIFCVGAVGALWAFVAGLFMLFNAWGGNVDALPSVPFDTILLGGFVVFNIFSLIKNACMTFCKNYKRIKINAYFNFFDDSLCLIVGLFAIVLGFMLIVIPQMGMVLLCVGGLLIGAFVTSVKSNIKIIKTCNKLLRTEDVKI